jgi:hypothetical protein
MPVRQHNDQFKVAEYTGAINRIANKHNIISTSGMFTVNKTSLPTFTFDLEKQTTTITGTTSEVGRDFDPMTRRSASVHVIVLDSFEKRSTITLDDLEGYVEIGTEGKQKSLANESAKRLTDLSADISQTHEYLQMTAMQGVTKSPLGEVLHDAYAEFGETRIEIDFDLGNAASDIDAHINDLIQATADNLQIGAATSLPHVFVSREFFDKLVGHDKVRDAWQSYMNNGAQRLRDSLALFYAGGANLVFEHRGVVFLSYNPPFAIQAKDGTVSTGRVLAANDGMSVPNAKGVLQAVYGSHRKLSSYATAGEKMYAEQYRDPRDEYVELIASSRCKYVNLNPKSCCRVHTST